MNTGRYTSILNFVDTDMTGDFARLDTVHYDHDNTITLLASERFGGEHGRTSLALTVEQAKALAAELLAFVATVEKSAV